MIDVCASVANHIGDLFTCATVGEFTRIRSPLMYPDGDYIDVYVKESNAIFTVTDLGETSRWLRMQSTAVHRSPKQKALIQDACVTHGVEWFRGMIVARAANVDEIPAAVLRVAQASLRVSDLWFTLRQSIAESITEDVAALLTDAHVPHDRDQSLVGRSQKPWRVDFHTRGRQHSALVEVLSTGSRAAGQAMVQHVVTVWYDLSYLKVGRESLGFVTLFDDTTDVWSPEDFALVSDLSDIVYWSRPEDFIERVAA
jgi:hypothetical protein